MERNYICSSLGIENCDLDMLKVILKLLELKFKENMNMENEKKGIKVVVLLNSGKQISFTSRIKYYNACDKDIQNSIGKDELLGLRTEEGSEFKRVSFINTKSIDNFNVTECELEEDDIIFEFGIVAL